MRPPEPLDFPHDLRQRLNPYLPGSNAPKSGKLFVTLTYAASLDSQIALAPGVQTAISGPETKSMTHYLRYCHDSIAVGAGTFAADNPTLNCRLRDAFEETILAQPLPVVFDRSGLSRVDPAHNVFQASGIGYGRPPTFLMGPQAYATWSTDGRNVDAIKLGATVASAGSLEEAIGYLETLGVRSIMIEGGASVIQEILRSQLHLVDTLIVTVAPVYFGQGGVCVCPQRNPETPHSPVASFSNVTWLPMGNDVVMCAKVK